MCAQPSNDASPSMWLYSQTFPTSFIGQGSTANIRVLEERAETWVGKIQQQLVAVEAAENMMDACLRGNRRWKPRHNLKPADRLEGWPVEAQKIGIFEAHVLRRSTVTRYAWLGTALHLTYAYRPMPPPKTAHSLPTLCPMFIPNS